MFSIVKRFYDRKIYSADDVKKFILSGKITVDEYKEITGSIFEYILNLIIRLPAGVFFYYLYF